MACLIPGLESKVAVPAMGYAFPPGVPVPAEAYLLENPDQSLQVGQVIPMIVTTEKSRIFGPTMPVQTPASKASCTQNTEENSKIKTNKTLNEVEAITVESDDDNAASMGNQSVNDETVYNQSSQSCPITSSRSVLNGWKKTRDLNQARSQRMVMVQNVHLETGQSSQKRRYVSFITVITFV